MTGQIESPQNAHTFASFGITIYFFSGGFMISLMPVVWALFFWLLFLALLATSGRDFGYFCWRFWLLLLALLATSKRVFGYFWERF